MCPRSVDGVSTYRRFHMRANLYGLGHSPLLHDARTGLGHSRFRHATDMTSPTGTGFPFVSEFCCQRAASSIG